MPYIYDVDFHFFPLPGTTALKPIHHSFKDEGKIIGGCLPVQAQQRGEKVNHI